MNRLLLLLAVLSVGIASYLIFQNLDKPAIRIWDEAIYADNALDMYTYGDPIVMRRSGELTLYNTKPPLVIWLQTLSMHVFGVNEFAIRFPSALAGVLTCLLLLWFSLKTLRDLRIGIVAVLVLGTSWGFVRQHVVKTGDLDAVLVFWTTACGLLILHFLVRKKRIGKIVPAAGAALAFGFLTKGVAAFLPVPGLALCVIIAGRFREMIRSRTFWLTSVAVVVVALLWYGMREALAPGYLSHMWGAEYGRYVTSYLPWHHQPWHFYVSNWVTQQYFTPWVYALVPAIAFGLFSKTWRTPTTLLVVTAVTFLVVLSFPRVKLAWYDAPVYPLLATIVSIGFIALWDWITTRLRTGRTTEQVAFAVVVLLVCLLPVRDMYHRNAGLYLPVDQLEREGFSIRALHRDHPEMTSYKVLMLAGQNAHFTQVDFYLNAYQCYKGLQIGHLRDTSLVQPGDTILCCQEKQLHWLAVNFQLDTIVVNEIGCLLLKTGFEKSE